MARFAAVLAACAALAAAGCAGDDDPAASGTAPGTTAPPASSAPPSSGAPSTGSPEPEARGIRLEPVLSGLEAPVYVASPPGDRRLFVVQQGGQILVAGPRGQTPRAFLDIQAEITSGGEQGLLSVAFHPDYAENGRLFVNYTDNGGDTRVVEYRARAGGGEADPASARELIAIEQPYSNHNGGQLQFGPDGLLYVGMGDGGAGGDPFDLAQNPTSRLGKLLRVDVDRSTVELEMYALGLRNPWRFSFDRETGDLWIGDVGQNAREEIDRLAAGAPPGANFGWNSWEGTTRYEDGEPAFDDTVTPVAEYGRDEGCSVTGGYVYRGAAVPDLRGRYVYSDYCTGTIWALRPGGRPRVLRDLGEDTGAVSSFGEDADGELYVVDHGGRVLRFAPAG